jgi:hypothetical protein
MKTGSAILLLSFFAISLYAQSSPNMMTVMVDGKEYKSEPRRVTIGRYEYITGNVINPDKSLRFWIATIDGSQISESGKYLVVGENDNYNKDKAFQAEWTTGKYKGIAAIKYVEETKSPRMEFHVGESTFNGESIDVQLPGDGFIDLTFNATLDGSWWKESSTATAFGGVGRIMNKMEDKAVTGASGYDQNIDPEGNGYKKQKTLDKIALTDGTLKLKLK